MPTREDVKKLRGLFKREADEDFFFNNLKSAAWLQPLSDEKFFDSPPEPVTEGENIRFPAWAQSRYLARVANQSPALAVAIAVKIPQTDNPQVMHDLIEVALAVPPVEAVKLRKKVSTVGTYRTNYEGLRHYAAHLAKGGLASDALKVIQPLIGFLTDPRLEEKRERRKQQIFWSTPEATTRIGEWDFIQIIKDVLPHIVTAAPLETIRFLCDELDRGIGLSRWEDDTQPPHDASIYWRPSVSDHGQNRLANPRSHYVSAIRDTCELTLRKRPELFQEIDGVLAGKPWSIFSRLRIHIATLFPELAGDARLSEIALNHEFFASPWWAREYSLFMREHFKGLPKDTQSAVLGWVEQGPDAQTLERLKKGISDAPLDEEIVRRRVDSWYVRHLQSFKADLPEEWKKRYDAWIAAGALEDEHPGFATWIGDIRHANDLAASPITKESVAAMGVDGLISVLKAWVPPGTFLGCERSTVASVFEQHVKEAPTLYADKADAFAELHPDYVAVIIRALADAFVQKAVTNVEPILRLLSWVTAAHGRSADAPDEDDGWDYARLETARFLEKILPLRPPFLGPEYREKVWAILSVLARDPNPSVDKERLHAQTGFDAYTASLNRTRGTALHAVFRYAGWVKASTKTAVAGFQMATELPEVVELIVERLNPTIEPTRMVRTIFGQSFPILYQLEAAFARALKPRIFPAAGDKEPWELAWNTYVVSWNPGADMLRELSAEYARAVEELAGAKSTNQSHWDPHQALANQLTSFYWRGLLDWDSVLFQRFLTVVPASPMASTLGEIGRLLRNSEGVVDAEILGRLRRLWQARVDGWKHDKAKGVEEASSFSWWFSSGKFEREWATQQMIVALDYSGTTSTDFMVLETFAKQVAETPMEALHAILILAISAQETDRFFYADKSARIILYEAGRSGSEKVRLQAHAVRDRLLSLKYDSFRDALERPPGDND